MWTFYVMVNYLSVDCLQTIKCNVNGCHPCLRIIPTVLTFRHLCRVVLDPGLQLGDGFQVSWRRCLHSICLCPAQLWDRVNHLMVELIKFESGWLMVTSMGRVGWVRLRRQRKGNTALWVGNPDEDNTFASDKNTAAYKLGNLSKTF